MIRSRLIHKIRFVRDAASFWTLIGSALSSPALAGIGSLAAVIVAAAALVWQSRAQRENNYVTYLLHAEGRFTQRIESLQNAAAANIAMALGADQVIQPGTSSEVHYQKGRGDPMVALAAFQDTELLAVRALTDAQHFQDYAALREAADAEIRKELIDAKARRDNLSREVGRLIGTHTRSWRRWLGRRARKAELHL